MNTWSWPQGCLNEAMLTEITANSINSSFGRNLKPQLEKDCKIQIPYPLWWVIEVIDCLKLCSFDAFGSNEASLQISPAYRIWPQRWIFDGKRWTVLKSPGMSNILEEHSQSFFFQFENAWLCVLHLVLWDWQMLLVCSCSSRTCVLVWELSTNRQPLHCHLFGLLASPLPVAVRPFFRLLLLPSGHKRWIFETDFHNSIQMYSVFSTAILHRNFAVAMNLARRVLGWDSLSIVAGL